MISDEVYGHLAFGSNPFVPMGVFGSTVPVLTLGSIAKRWIVPGWRLGWIVTSDPNGIFHQSGVGASSFPLHYITISIFDIVFIVTIILCFPGIESCICKFVVVLPILQPVYVV